MAITDTNDNYWIINTVTGRVVGSMYWNGVGSNNLPDTKEFALQAKATTNVNHGDKVILNTTTYVKHQDKH